MKDEVSHQMSVVRCQMSDKKIVLFQLFNYSTIQLFNYSTIPQFNKNFEL